MMDSMTLDVWYRMYCGSRASNMSFSSTRKALGFCALQQRQPVHQGRVHMVWNEPLLLMVGHGCNTMSCLSSRRMERVGGRFERAVELQCHTRLVQPCSCRSICAAMDKGPGQTQDSVQCGQALRGGCGNQRRGSDI